MNYEKSTSILEKIKSAKNILLNCHKNPDADSVGGALAMNLVLTSMGKEVQIVCPDDLPAEFSFLPNSNKVTKTNFPDFDYSKYDLFIIMDTSTWDRVPGDKEISQPSVPVIVIDHHKFNPEYGVVNLVDSNSTSNSEILYKVFLDWNIEISKDIATCLLAGIIGDTGSFQFAVGEDTLNISSVLIAKGASKDEITFNLFRQLPFENLKVIGELLQRMNIDQENKFIWSALSYDYMQDFPQDLNLDVVDILLQSVVGTDFGIRMIEKDKGELRISFRARTDFDTAVIAKELGGGGHAVASGATLKNIEFNAALEKVLATARKYTKNEK